MAKHTTEAAKAQRTFSDVQIEVTEVIGLVGCLSSATLAAETKAFANIQAALAGKPVDDRPETDLQAACDGILRMLEKISNDLCDLEPGPQEVCNV